MEIENKKFVVISRTEGTMSNVFYYTGKDFTSEGIGVKFFTSEVEASEFVKGFNNGENDLYVEAFKPTHHVINTTTGKVEFEGDLFACKAKLDKIGALGMKGINESMRELVTNP